MTNWWRRWLRLWSITSSTVDRLIEIGADRSGVIQMLPLHEARVAIDTIREALMEPTEKMRSAAEEADWEADYDITFADCWRAMLAASPLGEKSE